MLMPPRNAVRPSTISSLRWSRWFSSQSLRASEGFIGLNSSTLMPLAARRSKKADRRADGADAVADEIDLHALPLLVDQRLRKALADIVVVQDVGLHVDVVAAPPGWPPASPGRWPGRPGAAAPGCRWSAGCRRWPPRAPGGGRRCRSPGRGSPAGRGWPCSARPTAGRAPLPAAPAGPGVGPGRARWSAGWRSRPSPASPTRPAKPSRRTASQLTKVRRPAH